LSRIPATTFRALLRYLPGLGIDQEAALRGTGVDPDSIAQPRSTIESGSLRVLIHNLLELYGEPDLGLVLGLRARISDFGLFGYAMMSCPSLGDAARMGMRFWGTTGAEVTFEEIETETHLYWRPHEAFPLGDLWTFACERWVAAVIGFSLYNTGANALPYDIELDYAPPAHADRYFQLLRTPVRFGCEVTQLSFPKNALSTPSRFNSQESNELFARQYEALSRFRGDEDPFVTRLREVVVRSAGRFPSLDEAAAEVGVSGRTLRRRLREHGETFQSVLDSTRADLATQYLTTTEMTVQEVASLVGFSEANNFTRAFRKWTGHSASEVRRR
jgi:AraC-like DNA-binding protein